MIKAQIQVPEELFRELRSFAKQREWSLAETFRRGAALLLQVYPEPLTLRLSQNLTRSLTPCSQLL
jgi:hypothetical protein